MDLKTMKIRNAFKKTMIAISDEIDKFWEETDSALLIDDKNKFEYVKTSIKEENIRLTNYLQNIISMIDSQE